MPVAPATAITKRMIQKREGLSVISLQYQVIPDASSGVAGIH